MEVVASIRAKSRPHRRSRLGVFEPQSDSEDSRSRAMVAWEVEEIALAGGTYHAEAGPLLCAIVDTRPVQEQ